MYVASSPQRHIAEKNKLVVHKEKEQNSGRINLCITYYY